MLWHTYRPSGHWLKVCLATLAMGVHGLLAAPAGGTWIDRRLNFPYSPQAKDKLILCVLRQDYEQLERNRSAIKTPLIIGSRRFAHGLGTHSISHLQVFSPEPLQRFSAWIGIDMNDRTEGKRGAAIFKVATGSTALFQSSVLRGGQEPQRVEVEVPGGHTLDLLVGDGGDGPGWDHADWAEATITTTAGRSLRLDELEFSHAPWLGSQYPFSFRFGGKSSDECLSQWKRSDASQTSEGRLRSVWEDADTGLRVVWEAVRFNNYPALDWVLYFENTATNPTPIIANIQALDLTLNTPISPDGPYRLHRTKGAPSNPTDFEPELFTITTKRPAQLSAGGGRSSNHDFPFFTLDTGKGSLIVAVGWSGQWQAQLRSPDNHHLHLQAGMELTHFKLLPGEKVRSPRILLFHWDGEPLEGHAQFRQLIYRHYCAPRSGAKPLPTLFCNTCFTRGGGWLNECNAANQISLIRAFGKLGLEALITDAGWFEGGWPAGAGNWTPRKDAYPNGMAPVAAAARDQRMVYGLWFEPERVVAGTELHRQHPDWVLSDGQPGQTTLLANFGKREVQDYFFQIAQGFMALPGFRFYRQDFNLDPLPYWRHNDAPDRQGLTEIRYLEGLYAYWERLAGAWPDSWREECASGGRRIDLETVTRMHLHQKSDYWFDADVDQASLWSLSHYLPNNTISVPLNRLDDYSFHSALAASLIPGWIADAPDFDTRRAQKLLDRYREIRPFLIGGWYPLLPYSRRATDWIASQYHRPDLQAGMILLFRRAQSPYRTIETSLHGLELTAAYELTYDSSGQKLSAQGAELMRAASFTLPEKPQSELIIYRKTGR